MIPVCISFLNIGFNVLIIKCLHAPYIYVRVTDKPRTYSRIANHIASSVRQIIINFIAHLYLYSNTLRRCLDEALYSIGRRDDIDLTGNEHQNTNGFWGSSEKRTPPDGWLRDEGTK